MRRLMLSVFCMSLFWGCGSASVKNQPLSGFLETQGHRGARGLRPENTWPAFEQAIHYKMTTLELDTVLTKDNQIVIHHNSSTNPVICRKENGEEIPETSIYELTLAQLKELDCGSKKNPDFPEQQPVPGTKLLTIQEFFAKVAKEKNGKELLFNIETKFPDGIEVPQQTLETHVTLLLQAIQKAGVTKRTTIQSFYLPSLVLAKKQIPNIQTSALFSLTRPQGLWMILGFGDGQREEVLQETKQIKADIISPYFLYVTNDFVTKAHKMGIKVIPWTVNDKDEMRRLIRIGTDGIITDYPNRLAEVFGEK